MARVITGSWIEEFVEGKRILMVVDTRMQGEIELRDIRRVLEARPDIEVAQDRKDSIRLANGGLIYYRTVNQLAHPSYGTRLDRIVQLQWGPLPERIWMALAPCLVA